MEGDKKNRNKSLDLTSPSFDPLRALYSKTVILPNPDAPILDNLSKFSLKDGKISIKGVNIGKSKVSKVRGKESQPSTSRFLPHQHGVLGATASHPRTPSLTPTPSEYLRPEVIAESETERSTWENIANIVPKAKDLLGHEMDELEASEARSINVTGPTITPQPYSNRRGQEDSRSSSGDGKPEGPLAASDSDLSTVNGSANPEADIDDFLQLEGLDSRYEREESKKDFLDKSDSTPTLTLLSTSLSPAAGPVGSLTILAPTTSIRSRNNKEQRRSDSPDCELVGVEKLPALPSGISFTECRKKANTKKNANKENSRVANILVSCSITVTSTAKSSPPPSHGSSTPLPLFTLNPSYAVSNVPASQLSNQIEVPQGVVSKRQAGAAARKSMIDLTTMPDPPPRHREPRFTCQASDPPSRHRVPRFTCQVCDKIFSTQEKLYQHLATHRSPSKLPYMCRMCNARFPTHHMFLQHKKTYHQAQDLELALPLVNLCNNASVQKLDLLGIRHCLVVSQLTSLSGGVFGVPIVAIDNGRDPAICNIGELGASNILSLGMPKLLS